MFNNDNRKTYEYIEDWEDNPAGKAMLKMPWLFEEGEYPQKKETAAPETSLQPAAETPGLAKPQPDPFMQQTRMGNSDKLFGQDGFKNPAPIPDTADMTQTFTNNFAGLKARPEALQEFTRSRVVKPATPQASTFPYNDMGQLAKPASDKIIKDYVEPASQAFIRSVKDKQPADMAENDLVKMAAPLTKPVTTALHKTYAVETYIPAADSIHQGETLGMESIHTTKPPKADDIFASIHAGDSLDYEYDMANPNDDFLKGTEYTSRENEVSQQATKQVWNRILDPNGIKTKALDAWMKKEEAWLENNPLPELRDFSKIDWTKHPDKVLELGGKYFRQTFLGSHAYGLALSMIDSQGKKGNPVLNQQVEGTMSGIARIYCAKDEILQAAVKFREEGKASEGWEFMVEKATGKLPLVSCEGLRFLNRFLTQEQKKKLFYKLTEGVRTDTGRLEGSNTNRQK